MGAGLSLLGQQLPGGGSSQHSEKEVRLRGRHKILALLVLPCGICEHTLEWVSTLSLYKWANRPER